MLVYVVYNEKHEIYYPKIATSHFLLRNSSNFGGKINTLNICDFGSQFWNQIRNSIPFHFGARGGVVVEALRYKLAGRGFNSRRCHWIFQ